MSVSAAARRASVFVSYGRPDEGVARRLAIDLRAAGVGVWFDQWELPIGEPVVDRIERGVDVARFVVVLISPASLASSWVDREWRRKAAEEARGGHFAIVPVLTGRCEVPDVLAHRAPIDLAGGSYPLGLRQLVALLRHHADDAAVAVPEGTLVAADPSLPMVPMVVPLALEVGAALAPLFEEHESADRLLNRLLPEMREELGAAVGFPLPGVQVRIADAELPPEAAVILVDEIPERVLEVRMGSVLVAAPAEALAASGFPEAVPGRHPDGGPGAWLAAEQRAAADAAGFVTWDPAEVLVLGVAAVLRSFAPHFLGPDEVEVLLEHLRERAPELVAAAVPRAVSVLELTDVLRRLLEEEIPIGDLDAILSALAQAPPDERDTALLAERARRGLSGAITARHLRGRDALPVLALDPVFEDAVRSAIVPTASGRYLALDPERTQEILAAVREAERGRGDAVDDAPILTDAMIRAYIRRLVALEHPTLHVLSRAEVAPGTPVRIVGRIEARHAGRGPRGAG